MRAGIAVLLVAALVAGCSSSAAGDGEGSGTSITVDAAASLAEAFTTLGHQFEKAHPGTAVRLTFGASSDLATQIREGARVDVFASASPATMQLLGSRAIDPVGFVENTLEIAVPPDNPAGIRGIADLARSGVKVATCAPAVPCGAAARTVFANAGIAVRPAASLTDVKATLGAVQSGEVDAGLVYVTDVRSAGAKVRGIPIPADVNARTTYPIAVLRDASHPVLANAWIDYVRSAAGRRVLLANGFVVP